MIYELDHGSFEKEILDMMFQRYGLHLEKELRYQYEEDIVRKD